MKGIRYSGIVFVALAIGSCTRDQNRETSDDKSLQNVADRFGADYVGKGSIVVYARDPDGMPLKGCGDSFCRAQNGISIVVFSNPSRSLESHGTRIKQGDTFSYFFADDGAVSPYGFIEYRPTQARTVWIQRQFGDGAPVDTMEAEFTLGSGRSVRYLYKGRAESDHARVYKAVQTYLTRVGLE